MTLPNWFPPNTINFPPLLTLPQPHRPHHWPLNTLSTLSSQGLAVAAPGTHFSQIPTQPSLFTLFEPSGLSQKSLWDMPSLSISIKIVNTSPCLLLSYLPSCLLVFLGAYKCLTRHIFHLSSLLCFSSIGMYASGEILPISRFSPTSAPLWGTTANFWRHRKQVTREF